MNTQDILRRAAKYINRVVKKPVSGADPNLSLNKNISNALDELKRKGVKIQDFKHSEGYVAYNQDGRPIELGRNLSNPNPTIDLHEIGHAERALNRVSQTGAFNTIKNKAFLKALDEDMIIALQILAMFPLGLSQDPSMAIPVAQGLMATPRLYEELMASKSALDKLKSMGINKSDVSFARNQYIKSLGGYGGALLFLPAIAAAYAMLKSDNKKKGIDSPPINPVVRAGLLQAGKNIL